MNRIELSKSGWQKLQVLRISWMLVLLITSLVFDQNRHWKLGIFWTMFQCLFVATIIVYFWLGLKYQPEKVQGKQTSE